MSINSTIFLNAFFVSSACKNIAMRLNFLRCSIFKFLFENYLIISIRLSVKKSVDHLVVLI